MTIVISVHILKSEKAAIQFTFEDTLEINLKPGMKYFVRVVDPKYTLMTANPKTVPGKLIQLPKTSGLILVYFDVGDPRSGQGFFRESLLTTTTTVSNCKKSVSKQ